MTAPVDQPPRPPIRLVKPPPDTGDDDEDHFTLPPDGDMRPQVQLHCDLSVVVDKTIEAWAPRDGNVYTRSGNLVTVVNQGGPSDELLKPETPRVLPLTPPGVSNRLMRFVRFVRKGPKGWGYCSPTPRIVSELAARGEWPGVRRLVGLAETPFLRPDGTVCQTPGYDDATGYLYVPSTDYPPVSERPTVTEAYDALAQLQEPFGDFPFVSPESALVPVAAILTMLARPAIEGSVPCFAFDAATRRSGKSRLCDSVSIVTTGRGASRATLPDNDEELEKVLSAYALAGSRLILLDNVTRTVGGGPLDKVLTATDTVDLRVLGKSEIQTLSWTGMLLLSGNNMSFGEDTLPRTLLCRLESPLEDPETRTDFKHPHLLDYLRRERVRLVSAGLTVLRAWTCLGLETDRARFAWGGFDEFAWLVPPALCFAGGVNLLGARPAKDRAADDVLGALATIHEYLPRLSESPLTARAIVKAIYPPPKADQPPDGFDQLRDALDQLGAYSKGAAAPSATIVARVLGRTIGRVVGGRRLRSSDDGHGVRCFWVQ